MPHNKIIPFDRAPAKFEKLRSQGKVIVQCHGTFDLIHPGHIIHFEEAKALGDVLVVTITGEKFVNKGPGRPYFNDQLRSRWLAALGCVDYVVVVPHPAAVEAIECVRPRFYCKGREYEDQNNDVTGNIRDDIETVRRLGGEMRYVGAVVFSSTRMLNEHFDPYPPEVKKFCRAVAEECSATRFREIVDDFQKLRVLIIGDIIFDRYTTVSVQGLTSKNRFSRGDSSPTRCRPAGRWPSTGMCGNLRRTSNLSASSARSPGSKARSAASFRPATRTSCVPRNSPPSSSSATSSPGRRQGARQAVFG
jgi:cytidyltransferase-like protein